MRVKELAAKGSTGMGAGIGQLHGPAAGLRAPYFGFKKGKH
jgi:hypothetical protein